VIFSYHQRKESDVPVDPAVFADALIFTHGAVMVDGNGLHVPGDSYPGKPESAALREFLDANPPTTDGVVNPGWETIVGLRGPVTDPDRQADAAAAAFRRSGEFGVYAVPFVGRPGRERRLLLRHTGTLPRTLSASEVACALIEYSGMPIELGVSEIRVLDEDNAVMRRYSRALHVLYRVIPPSRAKAHVPFGGDFADSLNPGWVVEADIHEDTWGPGADAALDAAAAIIAGRPGVYALATSPVRIPQSRDVWPVKLVRFDGEYPLNEG